MEGSLLEYVKLRDDHEGPARDRLLTELCKAALIFFLLDETVSSSDEQDSFEATTGGGQIAALFVQTCQESKDRGFGRFLTQFDVMLGGVVEASFRFRQFAGLKEHFAHVAVRDRQPFFVSDDAMIVERLLEGRDGKLGTSLPSFLQGNVVMENAECPMVVQHGKNVQSFQIVRPRLLRMSCPGLEIAEIDQGMGDGVVVLFVALDGKDLPVTALGGGKVLHERAGIPQIAE